MCTSLHCLWRRDIGVWVHMYTHTNKQRQAETKKQITNYGKELQQWKHFHSLMPLDRKNGGRENIAWLNHQKSSWRTRYVCEGELKIGSWCKKDTHNTCRNKSSYQDIFILFDQNSRKPRLTDLKRAQSRSNEGTTFNMTILLCIL